MERHRPSAANDHDDLPYEVDRDEVGRRPARHAAALTASPLSRSWAPPPADPSPGSSTLRRSHPVESDLIVAIGTERDQAAFKTLFDQVAPKLKGYLLFQGLADALAEDIALETLVRIWLRAPDFQAGDTNPYTWMFTIMRETRSTLHAQA